MPFRWDPDTLRYQDLDTGRLVTDARVRRALDDVIDGQIAVMRGFTQQLLDGTLALGTWELLMMASVKQTHLVALAVAHGGWNQLGQEDVGWVGSQIKPQYQYLAKFTIEISTGAQKLDGTVLARAALYAQAARTTHREAQRRLATEQGMLAERNMLGPADHCRGSGSCLAETAKGWMPIGTLIPIGSRLCKMNCRCHLIYRLERAA